MNETSVGKWSNEIFDGENERNPGEKPIPRVRFVHHGTHMACPRHELGTPAVGGERPNPYATEHYKIILCYYQV